MLFAFLSRIISVCLFVGSSFVYFLSGYILICVYIPVSTVYPSIHSSSYPPIYRWVGVCMSTGIYTEFIVKARLDSIKLHDGLFDQLNFKTAVEENSLRVTYPSRQKKSN